MKARAAILALGLALSAGAAWAQYETVFQSPGALEQFRFGVQAYHRGRYAESILLLEKALAYSPGERLIQYWLGRAYGKSGFGETALRAWRGLLEAGDVPPFLRAKAEYLRASRSLGPASPEYRFVEAARFAGLRDKETFFLRPSSILARRDGSLLVVAHGSNELVALDSSGVVRERMTGGLAGFDRPFGLAALPDGTLFVSELNGDRLARIAPDGAVKLIGGKGRGPGSLIGPQHLAADGEGSVYVVDYGNSRVSKFDSEGGYLLSFGEKAPETGFPGFASPTGILEREGVVYVADSFRRAIYRFDPSGNYLGSLAEGELAAPEGLSLWRQGQAILVADTSRVLSLDLETEELREVYRSPDRKARIVGAVQDYNGNLAICDFDGSAVSILSESYLLASGYDVEIERIVADEFPQVRLELSVRDRSGSPVVGLGEGNFYLTERVRRTTQADEGGKSVIRTEDSLEPVQGLSFLGAGQRAEGFRATILLERSPEAARRSGEIRPALSELYALLAGEEGPGLVAAGPSPAAEKPGDLAAATRLAASPAASGGRFDLGLRLAATRLLPARSRDAVVYLGTGYVDESSFSGVTLSELGSLLSANGIHFYAVVLDEPSASLRYLAERTGGAIYAASRPRGLADLAADLGSAPSGRYALGFVSKADPVFGRAYLSVAAEAYLFKKSGKDELGYFSPLK
ncbi:MAG TPA: NHL repeat-containing protein [Spirochaetales bacterium]|nr:NHL repeat-containing protein [Spirochaetales bacterium]HRY56041.1 NHL repeat-containing protein [Spirochaetia bacterium]